MTQYFSVALNAVMPFIIYIAFGFAVVNLFRLTDSQFLNRLNKLVFQCFFPVMMFNNFANMDFSQGISGGFVVFAVACLFLLLGILFLTVGRVVKENARRGVIIQAIYRSNTVLFALTLAESVFGEAGTDAASMLVAVLVPIYNIFAVIILEYYSGKKTSAASLVKGVLKNPLIQGAIVGSIFVLLKLKLPTCMAKPVKALSDLTTPLSLFILGGTMTLTSFRKDLKVIIVTLGLKLVIVPAIVIFAMLPFGFTAVERFAVFISFAAPVAVSSFSMAANMGGDAELAGEFVAVSTVASLFTLFVWIVLLKTVAFI